MTVNVKIHHDRECKDIAWWWMRRFCMIANANILYERECKDSTWRRMPEPGWTWMPISKRMWLYQISAIMSSPLVLLLIKLLKCLDSNPLSVIVPAEGYCRNVSYALTLISLGLVQVQCTCSLDYTYLCNDVSSIPWPSVVCTTLCDKVSEFRQVSC